MNRNDVDWHGYWPASPTPFTEQGDLDEAAFTQLIDLYVSNGVHGILINGSTGEWFSQSGAERRRVTEVAVAAADRRIPVVIGVSAYTASESIELARHAATAGADGILSTVPPYVHPSKSEALNFYKQVSESTDLPMMAYNWPRGVSVDLAAIPGFMSELADLDQIAAIKDSTGNWQAMLDSLEVTADRVRFFGSFVHRRGLAVLLSMGGDGAIDGGGVGAPYAVPFFEAVEAGDRALAEFWLEKYAAISGRLIDRSYSGIYASPIPQLKAAMALLQQPGGHVRAPHLPVEDPDTLDTIAGILRDGGLLVPTAPSQSTL